MRLCGVSFSAGRVAGTAWHPSLPRGLLSASLSPMYRRGREGCGGSGAGPGWDGEGHHPRPVSSVFIQQEGGGSFKALSRESYSQRPGNVYSRRGVRAPSCTASFLGGVSERPAVCLVAMRRLRGRARGRRVQRRKRSFEKWPFRCFRPLTDTTSAPFGRPADEMAADHASRRQESFAERDSPHPSSLQNGRMALFF